MSEEKTKITDLHKDYAKFLGFVISCHSGFIERTKHFDYFDKSTKKEIKIKPADYNTTKHTRKLKQQYFARYAPGHIRIGIDLDRVISRLIMNKYIWKSEFPKSKAALTIQPAYDIVQYYNSVIRGLIHYYGPCIDKPYYLSRVIYLLTYSCYHTLAHKFRCSLKELLTKHGSPIKITTKIEKSNKKIIEKSVQIIYKKKNVSAEFEKTSIRRDIVKNSLYKNPKTIDYILRNETIKDPFSFKFLNW